MATTAALDVSTIPDFDDLPPVPDMPQGCAWGLFDHLHPHKDHLGCINLLTPPVVAAACTEARQGISVSLNWSQHGLRIPGFRKPMKHHVIDFMDNPNPDFRLHGFDDEVEINTQSSSQWDSLVHVLDQEKRVGYNGVTVSKEDLAQPFGQEDTDCRFPTLNHWHKRGGLVGRGVLLDYKRYAEVHSIPFNPFNDDKIYPEDLEKVAAWEGVEMKRGDILLVRTGYTEVLGQCKSQEEQEKVMAGGKSCGVYGSVETARWFWNKHPAAVAADNGAFEQIPPTEGLVLHRYFLCLFGLNIGELWDLKELSRTCAELNRYSFLLTSSPMNVPGLVGSPPNAIAVF